MLLCTSSLMATVDAAPPRDCHDTRSSSSECLQSRGTLLVERPRRSADLDKGPGRECSPGQLCVDKLSQDGGPWHVAHQNSTLCSAYARNPTSFCAADGADVDAYGLAGNKACCVCGGGVCDVLPQSPVIRESLMQAYAAMGGPDWTSNADWGLELAYCSWHGVQCDASGNVSGLHVQLPY